MKKATEINTEALKAQAQKMKDMGSPLSIEQIEAMLMKKAAKKAKKSAKNWKKRDADKAAAAKSSFTYGTDDMGEINRMNAAANLPSSMR